MTDMGKAPNPTTMVSLHIPTTSMRPCALLRRARSTNIANSTLTIRTLVSYLRLRAHPHACTASFSVYYFYRPTGRPRRTSPPSDCQRNNTAIRFATAAGAAFYNALKSKVGLAAAKAAALRVNLNINGCSIVAPLARPSRSSRASLTDSVLSHTLPMPHVH